jgi:hypothetical protein
MQPIRVIAYDARQTTTVFTDRVKNVNGDYSFYVRIPQCGLETNILVYNDNNGVIPNDTTFLITKQQKVPFESNIIVLSDLTRDQRSFVRFAQRFAYGASTMNPGVYKSEDGKFRIELLDNIVDENNVVIPTSFRIAIDTYDENGNLIKGGKIQASKAMIKNYTVPIVFFLLMHEYSHYNLNTDINNELEADLNALNIYLGMGYPYIDAIWALGITFNGNQTDENAERWEQDNKFIDDYFEENSKYKD